MACPQGDIFCRECAFNNLLSQRKEIKRLEKEMKRTRADLEEEERRQDEEARERAVREFEAVQMGLEAKSKDRIVVGPQNSRVVVEEEPSGADSPQRRKKRKFELDEEELLRIAREERQKARKAIEDEKNAKQHLPSFWVPSETPGSDTASTRAAKPQKLHTLCPSSSEEKPHQYALKTLTTVNFTEEKDSRSGDAIRSCPACKKALTNSTKAMLAIPCGHVVCKPCAKKFMVPHETADAHDPDAEYGVVRCYVCDKDLSEPSEGPSQTGSHKEKKSSKDAKDGVRPGLVEIRSEGTGFASKGNNVAKKAGVAFQC